MRSDHKAKAQRSSRIAVTPSARGGAASFWLCRRVGSLPEKAYRAWHHNGHFTAVINYHGKAILVPMNFTFGELLVVQVEPELFVANLIGQGGIGRDAQSNPPVRYEAIRQGLKHLRFYAAELDASVHLPRIGADLAGGDWEVIARIIEDELCAHGISVTIYDLAKNGQ